MLRLLAAGTAAARVATAATTPQYNIVRQTGNNTASLSPSLDRWPGGLHLAVDYYPSQWPEYMWEPDVARMAQENISYVRVSEFDWAVLEPAEGQYNFTLLDKTLEIFSQYGIKAIIGTPTAGPPDWVMEKYDVAFVDRTNATLLHGSRRDYSFSSFDYRTLSQNITQKMAERYGSNEAVVAWQLDNEFGCHDTVRSYDQNAVKRFRTWLEDKYGTIENMNELQGRVFWSQGYASFNTVQPPFLEVYTNNYAHTLDWYTFSSDMVIEFAKEQVAIIRQYAPTHAITTNMMMTYSDFDHHKFAVETGIDFATFDEYPLSQSYSAAENLRTGLPDAQTFHHALYRGVAGAAYGGTSGPFGVMEMEPGVLNWNPYRVSPLEGMVRLWTHETFASSGDLVNYFRWRQVPYAQEQTLSGLFLSDNTEDEGFFEIQQVAQEDIPILRSAGADTNAQVQGDVALVYDYTSLWVWGIEPHSGNWDVKQAGYDDPALAYYDLAFAFHSSLRRLGLSVDIISPNQPLDGYKMVVVPSLPIIPDAFNAALAAFTGPVVFGPHTGSKTPNFAYALGLNPSAGTIRDRLAMRVTRVETPPDYALSGVSYAGASYNISAWEENIVCQRGNATSNATVTSTSRHRLGKAAACADDGLHYIAFNPPVEFLVAYLGDVAAGANVTALTGQTASASGDLGTTLRVLKRGDLLWAFNYGSGAVAAPSLAGEAELLIGEEGNIPAAGIAVWKLSS